MTKQTFQNKKVFAAITKIAPAIALLLTLPAIAQQTPVFTPGNLVVAVEGCGVFAGTCTTVQNGAGNGTGNSSTGGYGDNQAGPFTLFQYTPIGTGSVLYVNSLVLPQNASGANLPVSGEYGSSSEGTLQLSGSGQYLTIMGYGVNAAAFDANPPAFGAAPSNALGQSGSLTGQSYTAVPRVVALIDANGNINSSTALYNIYQHQQSPQRLHRRRQNLRLRLRPGQRQRRHRRRLLHRTRRPNTTPTPITGLDTTNNTIAQDTRDVQISTTRLYVSVDTKEGSGSARSYIGTLGAAGELPTTTVGSARSCSPDSATPAAPARSPSPPELTATATTQRRAGQINSQPAELLLRDTLHPLRRRQRQPQEQLRHQHPRRRRPAEVGQHQRRWLRHLEPRLHPLQRSQPRSQHQRHRNLRPLRSRRHRLQRHRPCSTPPTTPSLTSIRPTSTASPTPSASPPPRRPRARPSPSSTRPRRLQLQGSLLRSHRRRSRRTNHHLARTGSDHLRQRALFHPARRHHNRSRNLRLQPGSRHRPPGWNQPDALGHLHSI